VNGNDGKITEIGQVKENTSNVPAIENEKNKHLKCHVVSRLHEYSYLMNKIMSMILPYAE
jgi:hypothetical protein